MTQFSKIQALVVAGLMIAIGVLMPWLLGHSVGLPGTVLLPMHIPVLLGGLLVGPKYGLMIGVITPILSNLITGMPPTFPMLPIMIGELGVYGFVSGFIFAKTSKIQNGFVRVYASMLPAMILGRAMYGIIFGVLVLSSSYTSESIRALTVPLALVTGLPGIAIQLVAIPIITFSILNLKSRHN
ncbi:MAG: ECF transporter S component [Defluviitaleaceae bacterium]|nr:ECF transporter S component [Defluviitaleaceae bacterium]